MLFVDPDKVEKVVEALRDCLSDVREARGLNVAVGRFDTFATQTKVLALLSMITDQGPFVQGGTVFIAGFGTEKEEHFPATPVVFRKGA